MSKKRKARVSTTNAQPSPSTIPNSIKLLHPLPPVFPSSFCMQHEGNCPEVYAQGPSSIEKGDYRSRAARPTTAAIPGMAVCMAPAAFDELLDEPVAADDAAELALDPTLLACAKAELATLEALERAELAVEPAPAEAEEAFPLAPPAPKMVVEPTVVVPMVEPPDVSTETMAEVVIAEEDPPAPVEDEPDPPAPPTPKIVVEPTVVVPMVEPPEVSTETMAEVVIAEEDPPAP